jgi:hypothetical protein
MENSHSQTSFYRGHLAFRSFKATERQKQIRKYTSTLAEIQSANIEHQLDATITVLLIFKISSTCFGQAFAHLQERKTEMFLQHMV